MSDDKSLTTVVQAEIVKPKTQTQKISEFLHKPESFQEFVSILGERQANRYIASVLTVVLQDEKLQRCTPVSIFASAVRSATLGLSVDPAFGQAYLVAYGNVCTFMPGYRGFQSKARENGLGSNVDDIFEGEEVKINVFTGEVRINGENGFWRPPSDSSLSSSNGKQIIGHIATIWDLTDPMHTLQSLYMTTKQIEEYAEVYAPSYKKPDSPWNKNKLSRREMFRKTVLKRCLKLKANLNPVVSKLLMEFEDEQSEAMNKAFHGITIPGLEESEVQHQSQEQNLRDLGYGAKNPDPIDDKAWDDYLALCNQAEKYDVPYNMPNRETTTKTDLLAEHRELEGFVRDAKAQAENQ